MIGLGGWRGRDERWGPALRWRSGTPHLDYTPGVATHPPPHPFHIDTRVADHPITRGMPARWLHAMDELYSGLRGPATQVTVLATAYSPRNLPYGTGEHEPVMFTVDYYRGRVFHLTLGHVGPKDAAFPEAVRCVGYVTCLQRGVEWAADGDVSIAIPDDFPVENEPSLREVAISGVEDLSL